MGLKLTLNKENNSLYSDFKDAYWKITQIMYTPNQVGFLLECFPSRESSKINLSTMSIPSLSIGGACKPLYETSLYRWQGEFLITDIFPNGIPLGEDNQKTRIYSFIKEYTELPFEDVFEE